jgi:HNH endonuclease
LNCECCGESYVKKIHNQRFCSKECRENSYNQLIGNIPFFREKECPECKKKFMWCSKVPGQTYCTSDCRQIVEKRRSLLLRKEGRTEERECRFCKKSFTWSSHKPGQKFCSKKCSNDNTIKNRRYCQSTKNQQALEALREEVKSRVSKIFIEAAENRNNTTFGIAANTWLTGGFNDFIKTEIKERDEYKCRICESDKSLEIHHIVKRVFGGGNNKENLITLCTSCHRAVETGDEHHASRKCFHNAKKVMLGNSTGSEKLNQGQLVSMSQHILNQVFKSLSEQNESDSELLISIANALEIIEDNAS